MSIQYNSAARMIDPTTGTDKNLTVNENPSIARLPTRHHQHHANRLHETRNDETKQRAGKKKRLICYRCGGKGPLARLCPSPDDCRDVDEVGTEPSSNADSDPFGLDWKGGVGLR